MLTESEANLVWRRAAQLQAEAASRLESHAREQVALARTDGRDGAGREPSGGFRVTAVQAAAEEAGISRQFVSLALAELRADTGAGQGMVARSAEPSAIVRATLGRTPRTISISRVFDHSPRRVLAAMGMALQRLPAGLRLRGTIGGPRCMVGCSSSTSRGWRHTASGTGWRTATTCGRGRATRVGQDAACAARASRR
ncbi:MAG: hypothetical protein IPN47_19785 [Gemmatimonadetes bacterium]|nr:hypothetical protein [Gemmatimonadota bacterium]